MSNKIYPLLAGVNAALMDKSLLMLRVPLGTGVPLYNGSFAIDADGEWILVDAGTAGNDEITRFGKPPMKDETAFPELLARHGIDPAEVKTVVMTHLHWDHAWNFALLPNARFCVQEREVHQATAPYPHELTQYGYMGVAGYEQPVFTRYLTQLDIISGPVELRPGIRIVPTPGHTHGSQSVVVDTDCGRYAIVGDFCFLEENWERGIMIGGAYSSCREWYDSYRTLQALHPDHILTTHDGATYTRACWE